MKNMKIIGILAVLTIFVMLSSIALADSTGLRVPSAYGDDYNQFTNPQYVFADDSSYSVENRNGEQEDWYNFGFTIPGSATIDGIVVSIKGNDPSYNGNGVDVELSYNGGTTYTTTGYGIALNFGSDTTQTLGGASDTWGRTWSPSELSNTSFRIKLNKTGQDYTNAAINYLRVNIYYTLPTEFTVGPGQDYTTITECLNAINNTDTTCQLEVSGQTYTINGTYSYNINDSNNNGAIFVNVDDIILDCADTTFYGNGGRGVYANTQNNITVKNCKTSNYDSGFYGTFINESYFIDNDFSSGTSFAYGMYLSGSSGNHLINNTIAYNYNGLRLWSNSDNNVVTGNTISFSGQHGVQSLSGVDNNNFSDNTVITASSFGFNIGAGIDNILSNNKVIGCFKGIVIGGNNGTVIIGNNVSGNSGSGIEVSANGSGSYGNLIDNNLVYTNGQNAINIVSSDFDNVSNNIIYGAGSSYYSVNIGIASSNTKVWLNHFYDKGALDSGTSSSFCVGSEGNFYEESLTPVTGDCGPADITSGNFTESDPIIFQWDKQSAISGYTVTYDLFLDNVSIANTTSLSYTHSSLSAGNYTLLIIPWVNGSRINGTHEEQDFEVTGAGPGPGPTPSEESIITDDILYILAAFSIMVIIVAAIILATMIYTGSIDIMTVIMTVMAIAAGFGILITLAIVVLRNVIV